jgi:hypothetical protein
MPDFSTLSIVAIEKPDPIPSVPRTGLPAATLTREV